MCWWCSRPTTVWPVPEVSAQRKLPGHRIEEAKLLQKVEQRLRAKFGEGDWISSESGDALYLNRNLVAEKKLSEDAVEEETARFCLESFVCIPGTSRWRSLIIRR